MHMPNCFLMCLIKESMMSVVAHETCTRFRNWRGHCFKSETTVDLLTDQLWPLPCVCASYSNVRLGLQTHLCSASLRYSLKSTWRRGHITQGGLLNTIWLMVGIRFQGKPGYISVQPTGYHFYINATSTLRSCIGDQSSCIIRIPHCPALLLVRLVT